MNHLPSIAAALPRLHLDAMLITSSPNEFYAIGFHGEGYLLVAKDLIHYSTDSRYIEAAGKIEGVTPSMISQSAGHVTLLTKVLEGTAYSRIGFEEASMSVAAYNRIRKALPPHIELVPASELLTDLRASKDEEELSRIMKAQEITDRAFTEILNDIHPGVTEKEIAAKLTYYQMLFGASGNSFDPIVASGANGSMPHAIPTDKKIAAGDFITMDFGAIYEGYCSDMTRTVCVGEPTDEMRFVYDTVLKAQKAGIDTARAGVTGKEVHEAAHDVIRAAGYGDFFGHGFGHSLGIEIHESPNASSRNTGRMPLHCVVSAEPGIYLPGRFGVRIEDITLYRENDALSLTHSPKELILL